MQRLNLNLRSRAFFNSHKILKIMKKLFTLIFFATFLNLSVANAGGVGVVNLEEVLKSSTAMKDAQKKIAGKQAKFQKEIDEKQNALEAESKKIQAKKSVLSESAFEKEQDKFLAKVDKLKELVDSRQDSLKESSLDAIAKINAKIREVVEEIRAENDYDVVIPAVSAIAQKDGVEITDEVSKRLNKRLSTVKIK